MKFAISLSLALAVFLTCFELGSSRHQPSERYAEGLPGDPQRPNRQQRPQRQPPQRETTPPRGRFANIPLSLRATLGNGLLAKEQGGGFRRIDDTYRVMATLQGFLIMVQDPTGWVSGIYYPGTHELVQVHRLNLDDVRPIDPRLVPSEEQIQLWQTARFEPFPTVRRVRN